MGNDANSGATLTPGPNGPLKTIGRAKEKAVQFLSSAGANAEAIITLMAGKHPLLCPVNLPLDPGLKILAADVPQGSKMTFTVAEDVTPANPAIVTGAMEFSEGDGGQWTNAAGTPRKFIFAFDSTSTKGLEFIQRASNLRAAHAPDATNANTSPTFTQLFVEDTDPTTGKVKSKRATRARYPNAGQALNVDTSRFTYYAPNQPDAFQTAVEKQKPVVRVPTTDQITAFTTLFNGNTEVVFTRVWCNPRGIIAPNSYDVFNTWGYTSFEIPKMRNDWDTAQNKYPYRESMLADVPQTTSLDEELGPRDANGQVPNGVKETWNRGWLENNLEFLDAAGEWYLKDTGALDTNGRIAGLELHYIPENNADIRSSRYKIEIPVTFTLVAIEGVPAASGVEAQPVSGVRFIGTATRNVQPPTIANASAAVMSSDYVLKLRYSAWQFENARINQDGTRNHGFYSFHEGGPGQSGLIDGLDIDGLDVSFCEIAHYGACGIALGGNRSRHAGETDAENYYAQRRGRAMNVHLGDNLIRDGGGAAIRLDDYPKLFRANGLYRLLPGGPHGGYDNNLIERNTVHSTGRCFTDAYSINVVRAINTRIERNLVHDVPMAAISIGVGCPRFHDEKNTAVGNTVSKTMSKLLDCGAIHTSGLRKTRITGNTSNRTGAGRGLESVTPTSPLAGLIHSIYLDKVTTSAYVAGNRVAPPYATAACHRDMLGNYPPTRQPHVILDITKYVSPLIEANLCPRKEDLSTCGCSTGRLEAEAYASPGTPTASDPKASPENGSGNYVLFTPTEAAKLITFNLPNPEKNVPGPAKDVWYNLKIGMIENANYGKYQIFFNGKYQTDYPSKTALAKEVENIPQRNGLNNISTRLTEHQILWKIRSDDAELIGITFRAFKNDETDTLKPISFDYFEFLRSPEQQ